MTETNGQDGGSSRLHHLRVGWRLALMVALLVVCFPVRNGWLRLYLVLALPGLLAGASLLLRHRTRLWVLPLVALVLLMAVVLAPGRKQDRFALREQYVMALRRYEGTRYVWGGEHRFGIDCSGLVRRGLVDAHVREAWATANPGHLRSALDLWWHDCSARALGEGYRSWIKPLFAADAVNQIDSERLLPGDLAVTASGVHVMAYLGEGRWIEADPELRKVVVEQVPSRNPWFDVPVQLVRWRRLGGQLPEQQ